MGWQGCTLSHSRHKGLLNPISIAGGLDSPLVEVEYKGRQSNVILTTQGESTLKIFKEWKYKAISKPVVVKIF